MPNAASYHGGRLLKNIRVMTLWSEITWPDGSESVWKKVSQLCLMDQFFVDIVQSSYMTALSEAFSVPDYRIASGPTLGTSGLGLQPAKKGEVQDSEIRAAIEASLSDGSLPWPDADTCYFIMIPTDAIVIKDGKRSQTDFSGYHHYFTSQDSREILYCVIAPTFEYDDDLTESASHEFTEVITNPDGSGWLGPPGPDGRLQEVCDMCPDDYAQVSGYSVARFATTSPGPGSPTCAPDSDNTSRGQSSSGAIRLDKEFTRVSCLGNIIEGESALFHAEAFYRGTATGISTIVWEVDNIQPPGAKVGTPGSIQMVDFVVDIFYGVTSFDLKLFLTTILGCAVEVTQTFDVVTQKIADGQEKVCAFQKWWLSFYNRSHWPNPLPPLPGPPPPLPPWDPRRDFIRSPLTAPELDGVFLLGQTMLNFVQDARTDALLDSQGSEGQDVDSAADTQEAARRRSARPPIFHPIDLLQADYPTGAQVELEGDDTFPLLTLVTAAGDGSLSAFLIGNDTALYRYDQSETNGAWGPPNSMGGTWSHPIIVAANANGALSIFIIGNDTALYRYDQSEPNGTWGPVESMGGFWPGSLVTAANANGALSAFLIGNDTALYRYDQSEPNGAWRPPNSMGGTWT